LNRSHKIVRSASAPALRIEEAYFCKHDIALLEVRIQSTVRYSITVEKREFSAQFSDFVVHCRKRLMVLGSVFWHEIRHFNSCSSRFSDRPRKYFGPTLN
jgi:hypothetical protein